MDLRSKNVTVGVERAPNRSLFYAMGYTKEELENRIATFTGGRAAEEVWGMEKPRLSGDIRKP